MKKLIVIIAVCLFTIGLIGCSSQKFSQKANGAASPKQHHEEGDKGIAAKINKMSLDEKLGQMLMVGVEGTTMGANERMFIRDKHVGGVILYGKNVQSTAQTVQLINQLKSMNQNAGNPLPLFISVDQEGGDVERMPNTITSLPANAKVGQLDDQDFSKEMGQVIGKELQAFGFNMDFAPVLDIKESEQAAIGNRSFSSDKKIVSQLGVATMKGIQSEKVVPVVKHFPGYGSVTVDAHADLPQINYGLKRLEAEDWAPYKQAIASGADAVMVTHLMVPQLNAKYPASMSQTIMTDMLRNKLKFKGVVITDDMTMGAIEKHYPVDEAAIRSIKAGADIVLIAYHKNEQLGALNALKKAVHDGDISMKRIDESVARIMMLKQKYKLSNEPRPQVNIDALNQSIQTVLNGKREKSE
ncbi:beta-N-acetylhexosaminidase [Pullulanibacillus pueri]|uniref:beta-N-acetylhexosaminidase n=1 Tax=Pullulanibacillus pueri TaxID=1437324 RepID=A0A8J2ZU87_9BACL|nr:beta-N-acetylhexosaminidase [Pullulanibacillus pueri]MBM7681311.1 beta-N-acetylhexosaminidase [Pullulanibacillus pueri]GGH77639.1 glycoside hydrolase family 3 [Pullulanibacillus pueri]